MDAAPEARDLLRREGDRVTDRLRTWSVERVDRPGADGVTPAQLTWACAQRLADLAAGAQGRTRRPLPRLAVHAAADQLAVTVHDVLAEGDGPSTEAALDLVTTLRRTL